MFFRKWQKEAWQYNFYQNEPEQFHDRKFVGWTTFLFLVLKMGRTIENTLKISWDILITLHPNVVLNVRTFKGRRVDHLLKQGHNRPNKGWVLSPKYLLLHHITKWSKFSFRISTKLQHQNLDHTLASKCWPNFSFKFFTKIQFWNLDQILASKSWPVLHFKIMTKGNGKKCLFTVMLTHNAQEGTLGENQCPNMLRYTKRTGWLWGFRNLFCRRQEGPGRVKIWPINVTQICHILTFHGPFCRPGWIFMVQDGWYRWPTYSTTCFIFDPHLWGVF